MEKNIVCVMLPDGRSLVATDKGDNEYPGIQIALHDKDSKATGIIAWVEYNTGRTDYSADERLRAVLWDKNRVL